MNTLEIIKKLLSDTEYEVLVFAIGSAEDADENCAFCKQDIVENSNLQKQAIDKALVSLQEKGLVILYDDTTYYDGEVKSFLIEERRHSRDPKSKEIHLLTELFGIDSYFADTFAGELETLIYNIENDYPLTMGTAYEQKMRKKTDVLEEKLRHIGELLAGLYVENVDGDVRQAAIDALGEKEFLSYILDNMDDIPDTDRKAIRNYIR